MADLDLNLSQVLEAEAEGRLILGLDKTGLTPKERAVSVDGSGAVNVVGTIAPIPPATGLVSTLVAVAAGPAVALTAPAANTVRQTIQNRSTSAASLVLVRELGGTAGTGVVLGPLQSVTYDDTASLEAENIGGPSPVNVSVQDETASAAPSPTPPANLASTDVAVGIGATVVLTPTIGTTKRQLIQNKSTSPASLVLIREAAGTPGTGVALGPLASVVYDDVANLECENLAGPATTIAVQQENA